MTNGHTFFWPSKQKTNWSSPKNFEFYLLDKRVVEIYTFFSIWVGEFYFVYNSLTRLYFLLYSCSRKLFTVLVCASQWNGGMSCIVIVTLFSPPMKSRMKQNNPIERKRETKWKKKSISTTQLSNSYNSPAPYALAIFPPAIF